MAIKFLSGLNLSNVTAGSILKLDSNGNIVAAVDGTDYNTGSADSWTTTGSDIYRNSDVRIGTYQSGVAPAARLHVFDYQTTDPKLLIEDGNTGDASMQFKISSQSYTMGIDNSDSDKFIIANAGGFNLAANTHALEIATNGKITVPAHTSNGAIRLEMGGYNRLRFNGGIDLLGYSSDHLWVIGNSTTNTINLGADWDWDKQVAISYTPGTVGAAGGQMILGQAEKNNTNWTHGITSFYTNGSERMRINSSGNVGIGTNNPGASLHVASTTNDFVAKFSHSTATGYAPGSILLEASQATSRGQGIYHYNTNADEAWFTGVPYNVSSNKWIVANKPDTTFNPDVAQLSHALLTIEDNGRVGIGTTSPEEKLHVIGNIKQNDFIIGRGAQHIAATMPDYYKIAQVTIDATYGTSHRIEGTVSYGGDNEKSTKIDFWVSFRSGGNLNVGTPLVRYGYRVENLNVASSNGFESGSVDTAFRVSKTSDTSGGNKVYEIQFSPNDSNYINAQWELKYSDYGNQGSYPTTVYSTLQSYGTNIADANILKSQDSTRVDNNTWITQLGVGSSNNTSYSFYNNNTSYFNGNVTVDANLSMTGGGYITTDSSNALTLRSDVQHGQGDEDAVISFKQSTTELGKFDQDGYLYAAGFKKSGTTGFLKSDGTVDTSTYLTAHPSITQASNVDNSNGTVLQDLTFDSNGHVTNTGSVDLDGRYYQKSTSDAKYHAVDGSGKEWIFEVADESNITGNKWYKVATVNKGNGGLHIRGFLSNHVEGFAMQKFDLAIGGREGGSGVEIEIAGTVDVLHNATGSSTDKAGIRVIQTADSDPNYDHFDVYIRTTRYQMLRVYLTKSGQTQFHTTAGSNSVTTEPAPVSGGNVELDTSSLVEGHYIVQDSTATAIDSMAYASTGDYKDSDTVESYVATELGSYTATSSFGTNAFTSFSDHSTQGYLTSLPSHNHNDIYYTETELNGFFKSVTHQGNYISTANWSNDGSGTAPAGWSAEGFPFSPTGGFNQNGSEAENTRTVAELPNGAYGVVWRTPSNDSNSGADGGWDMDINNVQHGKAYRSVVYFQKTDDSTSGTFYHGCHGNHTLGMNGSAVTNPYFQSIGFSNFVENRWYVSVGYIQPYQYPTATDSGRSGIYDCYTGKKIANGADYMMKSGSTTQRHRTYQYYSTDPSSSINWWSPRFEEINGNEPSLAELIQRVGVDGELGLNFHSKFPAGALDSLTEATDATNDKILLWDESADVWKQMTLENLQDSIDTDTTNFATAAQGTLADNALPKAGGTMTGELKLDSNFKWATTNASSYTYSNADSSGLYIETVGNTDALSDMRFQARASGAGNYSSIAIKPSNQSIVLRTNGTNALVLDTSQNATLAGKLYIGSVAATTTATTALLLGAAGEVKKRGLGSNAFTSTTIPTGTAASKAVTDFIQDFGTSTTSNINTIGNASGKYRWNNTTTGRPASSQENEYGTLLNLHYSGNVTTQIAHDIDQANLWIRSLDTESDTGTAWKQIADTAYVSAAVAGIVDSAPAALDTLNELAAALGNDDSFSTTMSTALGNRLRIDVNNQSLSSTELANARTNLGLGTAATAASTAFVAVSGDTMTGALEIKGNVGTNPILKLYNTSNGNGAIIQFSDQTAQSQTGNITFRHADGQSEGGGASFHFESQPDTVLVLGNNTNKGRIAVYSAASATEVDYGFAGDVNTGMLRTSADNVSLVAGGVKGVGVGSTAVSLKYAGTTKILTSTTGITVTGEIVTTGGNSTNWNTAYTYSQVGHLPLAGGNLTGNLGINSSTPAAPLDVQPASDYKVTKVGDDRTSHYKFTGSADHTLTLASGSYYSAEVVITAHQTNGGTNNNLYIRGIWTNNHTSHHWHEIENIGGLSGSAFTITNGQSGDTTNSGELEIVHDYTSGSFGQMVVRVTDHYGTHSYTIS